MTGRSGTDRTGGAGGLRRVLVTGASGDIGRAVVEACVAAGAEVLAQVHSRPGKWSEDAVTVIEADLLDDDAADWLVAHVPDRWAGIDLLVNCVGGARPMALDELSAAQWRACMQLNVEVPFLMIKAAAGLLERAGGAVVNISSVAAFTGGAFGPHYAAAKAAVVGLTRSAARDLGPRGIRVNCVAPGPVDSAMTDALDGAVLAGLLATTALRRVVTPQEVADTVLWLAGSGAVTGQTLVVDGGRVLR
jgi:3-oxoacyl-[acyl-carrier protein] reductase